MKGIDNILKPLYDLWHKVMDKMKVVDNRVVIDGHEIIVKFIVENIKSLTDEQCDALQCGDVVAKKTGNMFHLYQVTYKENKHGICLTYQAAGLQETQSYDYIESHWVYNSEDVVQTGGHTDAEVKALAIDAVEEVSSGTPVSVLGLDSGGNAVKGSMPSGGTKLYKHTINGSFTNIIRKNHDEPGSASSINGRLIVYNKSSSVLNSKNALVSAVADIISIKFMQYDNSQNPTGAVYPITKYELKTGQNMYFCLFLSDGTNTNTYSYRITLSDTGISDTVTEL